jgi:hypothetical protein
MLSLNLTKLTVLYPSYRMSLETEPAGRNYDSLGWTPNISAHAFHRSISVASFFAKRKPPLDNELASATMP